jgi:hypothetical protein
MQLHWKRYLLLIALVAVLAYVAWRVYEDYELRAYTRQMADSIPVPQGVRLVEQREFPDTTCRSMGIVRYYVTDLSWEQVLSLYQNYLETSPWKPFIHKEYYIWGQSSENQKLDLTFHQIKNTEDNLGDIERKTLNSGKTAYLVQVGYGQDIKAASTYCKPED